MVDAANPAILARKDGGRQSLTIPVRPVRWGAYSLGTVHLRAFDDFRLRRFEARVRADMVVRAYPATERLRTLVRPLRTHVYAGNRVAAQKAEGIEFADLRPYVSGDRVRSVDRRASARRGELWVNQRHPERNVDVVLLLDTFAHAGPEGEGTLEQMVRGASSLASAWLRDRDRIGVISFGGTLRWLEVGDGPHHAYRLIDALLDTQVVFSYLWKGAELIPVQLLPPPRPDRRHHPLSASGSCSSPSSPTQRVNGGDRTPWRPPSSSADGPAWRLPARRGRSRGVGRWRWPRQCPDRCRHC